MFSTRLGAAEKATGLDVAKTPLNAISQIQLELRVSLKWGELFVSLIGMVPSSTRNWIAINAVQQSTLNKRI